MATQDNLKTAREDIEALNKRPASRPTIAAGIVSLSKTTRGCTVAEIKHGKLTHSWVYWDTGHLLKQLRRAAVSGRRR